MNALTCIGSQGDSLFGLTKENKFVRLFSLDKTIKMVTTSNRFRDGVI